MRRFQHGGCSTIPVKAYTCRLCAEVEGEIFRGMEDDKICPWCAQDLGRRICEALNEHPGLNFFNDHAEYEDYLMRSNPDHIAPDVRAAVIARDGLHCQHCGSSEKPCLDHRIPSSRGGLPTADNLWVLCARCNISKRNRTVEEWLASGCTRSKMGRAAA